MRSAVYGRMRIGRCVRRDYGFLGCSSDVLSQVDRLCSGRQGCEFQVAELHGNQPCPGDLTPFLQASYECVPGAKLYFNLDQDEMPFGSMIVAQFILHILVRRDTNDVQYIAALNTKQ